MSGSHTAYALQAKEALNEQEEDIDLETAQAALELESDTDLEETDVQEIPLAYKKHGNCGESSGSAVNKSTECAAMISLASQTLTASGENGTNGNSWPSCNVMFRDGEEAKTSFFVYFG